MRPEVFLALKAVTGVEDIIEALRILTDPDITRTQRYTLRKKLDSIKSSMPILKSDLKAPLRAARLKRVSFKDLDRSIDLEPSD